MPDQTVVLLGNPNPMMQAQGLAIPAEHLNQSVTRVEMWPGFDDPEAVALSLSTDNDRVLTNLAKGLPEEHNRYAVGLHELEQILQHHAGSVKPDWVACQDQALAEAISHYYGCPIGEPNALITLNGRDDIHSQNLSASQPAPFIYGALSANSTTPTNANTTLVGEIATSGGGLIRALMTFAHTAGTNSSTLTKTWTANGSDALPVTLAKWAAFSASTAGRLGYIDLLSTTIPLVSLGDTATVTFTLTVG